MTTRDKDPDSIRPYAFNWATWLANEGDDTIADFTVTATGGGVTVDESPAPIEADGVVTYWLSGGTVGEMASVTCHIVTTGGREEDWTDYFRIRER